MVHNSFSSWSNEEFLTRQELLSPGQKTKAQNSVKREETLAPVSLKDFALENFRYYHRVFVFQILKWEKFFLKKDFPVAGLLGADMEATKARDCGLVPETFSDSRC